MDTYFTDIDRETLYLALAAGCVACFAEIMYGMVSFGPAILLTVGWQILHLFHIGSGTIQDSLVNVVCMETVTCIIQCFVLYRHSDTKLILHNTVPRCAFSILGMHILFNVDELWLKRAAGFVMLFIFAWRSVVHYFNTKIQVLTEVEGMGLQASLFCANAISGVSRGIFGIAGPPLMVFLTFYPLEKDLWRGSDAFVKVFTSINQILYLSFVHEKFTFDEIPIYSSCAFGGVIGLFIGNYLSQFVDPQNFQRFLLLLLFYSGLLLWASGFYTLQIIISAFIAVSSIGFGILLCMNYTPRLSFDKGLSFDKLLEDVECDLVVSVRDSVDLSSDSKLTTSEVCP